MRYEFAKRRLADLYETCRGQEKYAAGVVDAFFEVVAIIGAAKDIRDLYAAKSLHFEKMKGKQGKAGQRSLRLTGQWRLIVEVAEDQQGKRIRICEIKDYH